jgi:hypothetical protein
MVTGRETFRINSGPRRSIRPGRRASRSPRSSSTTTCRWQSVPARESLHPQLIKVCWAREIPHYGAAIDRVLGLPDGTVTALVRAQVETLVAALPREY